MQNLEHATDLIVFSSECYGDDHVRTSKLMNKFSARRRIYFFESALVCDQASYYTKRRVNGLEIIQTYVNIDQSIVERESTVLKLLKDLIENENITYYTVWTDTPKAVPFIRYLCAEIIVYDCLKDHSLGDFELEEELLEYSDATVTSGFTIGDSTNDHVQFYYYNRDF